MSKILPGLYLGRLDNAQNDNDMMANCITHVCSVHEPVKQKLQKFNSYEYFEVNVQDTENACISKFFSKTNDFIHDARMKNGNVLIHCLAGVSRAPTIVLAYLMTVYELPFLDAYNCLRAVRPNIKPNGNFINQLIDFENEVSTERSRLFKASSEYVNLEEDKKLIRDLIAQFENREHEDYYIGNSLDSNSDYPSNPAFDDSDNRNNHSNADNNPLLCGGSNLIGLLNIDTFGDTQRQNISHQTPSPTPERQSDLEEEVDIPGSIPIGMTPRPTVCNLGTSSSDYRGRAHSRLSNMASTADIDPIMSRYGQTAPPSLPLFFGNSD